MFGYYDEDKDLNLCKDFCNLWKKHLPELRPDMYQILLCIAQDHDVNVYSFDKNTQYYKYWKDSYDIINEIAEMQGVDIQIILDTMPSHLFVSNNTSIMAVHTSIGAISTANTIIKYFGLSPKIYENDYGIKLVKV